MTIDKKIKLIAFSFLLIIVVSLTVMLTIYGAKLGIVEVKPVGKLLSQRKILEVAQSNLTAQQVKFRIAVKNVDAAKQAFNDEKNKYDAISDETINIIKEATTEENYSLEYLWIKLGNYAKKNNLSIIVAEPGGELPVNVTTKDETDKTDKPTSGDDTTQLTDTITTTPQATTTAPKSTPNPPQASPNTVKNTTAPNSTTQNTQTNSTTQPNTTTQNTQTNSTTQPNTTTQNTQTNSTTTQKPTEKPSSQDNSDTFKIQVSGSYIDVSDFIFEVENDKELRFKLDNIKMIPVEGTKIITTFDIKKVIVKK